MANFWRIVVQLIPVILMIALISFIKNDYWLLLIYIVIIIGMLVIKYEKKDWIFLVFGCFGMLISEYLFISTKVETFNRVSLLGIMPIWLPVLWAYVFVVIKRAIMILEDKNLSQ